MQTIRAFITGAIEFRLSCTTSYDEWREVCAYDWGREIAHRVTFRRFEMV